jgi:hypothetical protein
VLVGAGWGDSKQCPGCSQQIGASLLVCSCGARFPWADPITVEDYRGWLDQKAAISRARSLLIVLFLLSLIGVTSPIAGAIAGIYARSKRALLAGSGGTYLAMGYGSAAIGTVYVLLIAVTALGR